MKTLTKVLSACVLTVGLSGVGHAAAGDTLDASSDITYASIQKNASRTLATPAGKKLSVVHAVTSDDLKNQTQQIIFVKRDYTPYLTNNAYSSFSSDNSIQAINKTTPP